MTVMAGGGALALREKPMWNSFASPRSHSWHPHQLAPPCPRLDRSFLSCVHVATMSGVDGTAPSAALYAKSLWGASTPIATASATIAGGAPAAGASLRLAHPLTHAQALSGRTRRWRTSRPTRRLAIRRLPARTAMSCACGAARWAARVGEGQAQRGGARLRLRAPYPPAHTPRPRAGVAATL